MNTDKSDLEDSRKSNRYKQFEEKFSREIPHAVQLLKLHLLVEELLGEIVFSRFSSPKKASEARLTFTQKLRLAEAVEIRSNEIFRCVDKLNAARNELAHRADAASLQARIDDFISACLRKSPSLRTRMTDCRTHNLDVSGASICGGLARIVVEYVDE